MLTQIVFRGLSNRFMNPDRLDSFKNVIHLITSQGKLKPNIFAVTISNDEIDTFILALLYVINHLRFHFVMNQ